MALKSNRPVYLDLRRIRMPVTAVVSLLHRISGAILFISVPFLVYLFDLSLDSEQGYARAVSILGNGLVEFLLLFVIWALLHHLFAGLRFLLIDFDVGVDVEVARRSAKIVGISGLVASLIVWVLVL